MICDSCKLVRLVSDFINNQKFCFHCMYRIKLAKSMKNHISKNQFCRICGVRVIQDINLKKRQRSIYCSLNCAKEGHKKQLNNHWTRTIRKDDSWKTKG